MPNGVPALEGPPSAWWALPGRGSGTRNQGPELLEKGPGSVQLRPGRHPCPARRPHWGVCPWTPEVGTVHTGQGSQSGHLHV